MLDLPELQYWITGTALYLAGSFIFVIWVALVGVRTLISDRKFKFLMWVAALLSVLAWWTAAKQERDASSQSTQLSTLRSGIESITNALKLPEGISVPELTKAIFDRMGKLQQSIDKLNVAAPVARSDLISETNAEMVTEALRQFANNGSKIHIGYAATDGNAFQAAQQWLKILKDAGWPMSDPPMNAQISAPPDIGIKIWVKTPTTPGAGVLQRAFASVGKTADGILNPNLGDQDVTIVFGSQ